MNPFERKFNEFAQTLGAKNAQGHAEHVAAASTDTFRDKPFTEEFQGVYKISLWGQSLAQVVTYATTAGLGVFALQHIIIASWGIFVAVPLALLFAYGVERVKRSTLAIASKHLLKYKTFGFVGIVAALVMCVSIAAALYGAKELPGVFYPKPHRIVDAASVELLTADIDKVQADIDRTTAALTSGKNWIAENRTLPRLQKERATLIDKRDAAQKDAAARGDTDHAEALAERESKVGKMQVYAVGAAIVAELIFLFCTGFIFYYLFRAFAEMEQEQEKNDEPTPPQPTPTQPKHNGATVAQNLRVDTDNVVQTVRPDASARADGKRATQHNTDFQTLLPGQRICEHCQTVYTYGHARQRFCSEKCRIENWQEKNGKEIRHRINVKA
jgi:hypothetical protein